MPIAVIMATESTARFTVTKTNQDSTKDTCSSEIDVVVVDGKQG